MHGGARSTLSEQDMRSRTREQGSRHGRARVAEDGGAGHCFGQGVPPHERAQDEHRRRPACPVSTLSIPCTPARVSARPLGVHATWQPAAADGTDLVAPRRRVRVRAPLPPPGLHQPQAFDLDPPGKGRGWLTLDSADRECELRSSAAPPPCHAEMPRIFEGESARGGGGVCVSEICGTGSPRS